MTLPECWIVMNTMTLAIGGATMAQAAATCGVPCHVYVEVDKKREGYTKTINRALAVATGTPYVCCINDDVSFPQQDWLRRLIEALEEDPRHGIAGPSGNCATRQNRGRLGDARGIYELEYLSFFCTVFKRTVLDELGLLDEDFIHYGSDNDYCERARLAGWKCIWVRDIYVEHDRSPVIPDWKERDVRRFKEKWRS